MKFKQYVENLNKLLEQLPETADYDVVTRKDEEGNGFKLFHYKLQVVSDEEENQVKDGPVREFEDGEQLGKVTVGDYTAKPDIWKDAHKSKERPRGCPMDDCDLTTRSKSNKVARSTIGRHRKKKHPETLNA